MKINKTKNYEKFTLMATGNRFIKDKHVAKMGDKISTLDLTMVCPIICYRKGTKIFILEGQHRFEACRLLKKPIFYVIVPKTTNLKEYILQLNSGNKVHTVEDRLKIQKARKVYNLWRTSTKNGLSLTIVASLLMSFGAGGQVGRALERGTYKVNHAKQFKVLHDFINSLPLAEWKWRGSFVYFMADVYKHYKGRELARILKRIKAHPWEKESGPKFYRQQFLDVQEIALRGTRC